MTTQKTEIAKLFSSFEECRFEHDGTEAWRARVMMPLLGYPQWREFRPVIERAWNACKAAEIDPARQFLTWNGLDAWEAGEKVFGVDPKNLEGGRPSEDVILTRRAAYLVAMNGDPRKTEVAFAQHYFAAATRTIEVIQQRMIETERLVARGELTETEARFQGVLYDHGVDGAGIGRIRSRGDQALFGKDTQAMKRQLDVPAKGNRPLADFAPEVVISAKRLGAAMTTHNVKEHDLRGERAVSAEHVENNLSVRKMAASRGIDLGNVKPEEDIKKVERRHAAEVKKLQQPDKPKSAAKATGKGKNAQSEKFIEAARDLGCTEDESRL